MDNYIDECTTNIFDIINQDKELMEWYLNDQIFHNAINATIYDNLSMQDALIFILKAGYQSKNEILKKYMDHMQPTLQIYD